MFAATALAVPEVVVDYGVNTGAAALISTAQVGGFTVANLLGGRRLVPSVKMARWAGITMFVANAASAIAPNYASLIALRGITGIAMGLLTWIAWADSADDDNRRGEIAALGPVTSVVAAPLIALASWWGGLDAIYLTLAGFSAVCLLLPLRVDPAITRGRRPIEARGVIPVLLGMGALALGGSAVFVFSGVIADNLGMSTIALSLALSLNAITGIPAARYAGRRRMPGGFIAITALCALALATVDSQVVFFAAMALWGAAFWMAVPEAYTLLSERSKHPADRIGDAQAVMALGRVIGPTVGGILVAAGSFTVLGVAAAGIMLAGAILVEIVATSHRRRR